MEVELNQNGCDVEGVQQARKGFWFCQVCFKAVEVHMKVNPAPSHIIPKFALHCTICGGPCVTYHPPVKPEE